MAIAALSTTLPTAHRLDDAAPAADREPLKRTIRRRIRRLPGFLLVLALLLPQLITAVLGSH